jgi:hypothetical protein
MIKIKYKLVYLMQALKNKNFSRSTFRNFGNQPRYDDYDDYDVFP